MFAGKGLQDGRLQLLVCPLDIHGWKTDCVVLVHPRAQQDPGGTACLEAKGKKQDAQALVRLGRGLAHPPRSPRACSGRTVVHRPTPARHPALLLLPASPSLLLPLPLPSFYFSFSPHLLLSFPPLFSFLLLPFPLSLSSYLIPLVFLLSACPADLHARCVEAAQLDLMPPATRSRAVSGPGAAVPQAGTGRCSAHPPPWPTLWPLSAFCSSSPHLHSYILYPMLLPSLLSSPSLLLGPGPVCPCCPNLLQPPWVAARGWTETLQPAPELGTGLL